MYMAALKALPVSEAKRKTQELLAMVGLEEISKKRSKCCPEEWCGGWELPRPCSTIRKS